MNKIIRNIISNCGVDLFGICSFVHFDNSLLPCRAISRLPNDPRSIIILAIPYKVNSAPPKNISRYAAVSDYHGICLDLLEKIRHRLMLEFSDNNFVCFCDNSPIPEVEAAARAGLGVIGDNGLLITKKYGSFVFICEIVTDLQLNPTTSETISLCHHCGICKISCPSGCANNAKTNCLSGITQKKGLLSHNETNLICDNGSVWGCDICQEMCPLNVDISTTYISDFISSYRNEFIPGENINNRAYEWRGESIPIRNYEAIKACDKS